MILITSEYQARLSSVAVLRSFITASKLTECQVQISAHLGTFIKGTGHWPTNRLGT